VNELINGKRAITPDAVRLAMFFGNEAAFWMHLRSRDMHWPREVCAAIAKR
jgi:plasmid maintenance system antidote protein VapI